VFARPRENDRDTSFQGFLVRVRISEPDGQDLIEVGRLPVDVGEEKLAASSKKLIRQVIGPAREFRTCDD
jgi:hypothetical protein